MAMNVGQNHGTDNPIGVGGMEPLAPRPQPRLYEQQPGETNKAFEAFQVYLAMGPARGLAAAGAKLGVSRRRMEVWSAKWKWVRRVAAYNADMAAAEREAAERLALEKGVDWAKRYQELRETEWKARCELVELAWEIMRRWRTPTASGEPRCGSLAGLARLLDLMSVLGRRSCEVATEVKQLNTTMNATIDLDWELALRKAYGQAEVAAAPPAEPPAPAPGAVVDVEEVKP